MKLLSKKETNTKLAAQKKHEIDQGLSLAKKIDVLRETHLKEEKSLQDFRVATIESVQKEIDEKVYERNSISIQIQVRREELQELQKPLDREWEKIANEREVLSREKTSIMGINSDLKGRASLIEQIEKQISSEKERIENVKSQTIHLNSRAVEALREAERDSGAMREQAKFLLLSAESKEKSNLIKDKELSRRENDVSEQITLINERETDLSNRERALTDKYETFMRTQKRIYG